MVNNWSKVVGVGLGYLAAGPIGAVIGYFVGESVCPCEEEQLLSAILVGLTAAVLQVQAAPSADDRRRTASFIARILRCDPHDAALIHQLLDHFLPLNLNVETMARRFSRCTDQPMRRNLLEILGAVCRCQGPVTEGHLDLLTRITAALDLPEEEWHAVKGNLLAPSPTLSREFCFALLGLAADAPMAEVKRAYRKLAKRYHPDHGAGGQASGRRANTEVMILINRAYKTIHKERD